MDAIALSLFASRIDAVCDEMGAVLRRAAFSPNIRDRLDFSCAVFDAQGGLCAQAAHIPVHLGSMAFAMAGVIDRHDWRAGDMLVMNDPFQGGTHLPDVTLIAPVFAGQTLAGFVANRAHHADIGASAAGSMPITDRLEEEGLLIQPVFLLREGKLQRGVFDGILAATCDATLTEGDFSAQISANNTGVERLLVLIETLGVEAYRDGLAALNKYAERMARHALIAIPDGGYRFTDFMDDDGLGHASIPITVTLRINRGDIEADFSGSSAQVSGNINCPLSVTAAAVFYVFRCLMDAAIPACAGTFAPISLRVPDGSLLHAQAPAAVAAGNVETSSRVVDVVLGALAQAIPARIPAASQGSMNNLAMGARNGRQSWNYYETLAGGMGASVLGDGLSAVQTHMTNTLNTPIEIFESHYPVRIRRYSLRPGSGGNGLHRGGDGLCRVYEFLAGAELTLISERRRYAPWGVLGGEDGKPGENHLNGQLLAAKTAVKVRAGDCLSVCTPGGGGWGKAI